MTQDSERPYVDRRRIEPGAPETSAWVKGVLAMFGFVLSICAAGIIGGFTFFFAHTQADGHPVMVQRVSTVMAVQAATSTLLEDIRAAIQDLKLSTDDRYRKSDAMDFQREMFQQLSTINAELTVLNASVEELEDN